MGALLDGLAERPWLAWLACIVWAALLAFLPEGYAFAAWPVMALVLAILALVGFDHFYRYAPLQRALKDAGRRGVPAEKNRALAPLMLLSAVMMAAHVWVFDFRQDTVIPLFLSVWLPDLLKNRRAEVMFMAVQQPSA